MPETYVIKVGELILKQGNRRYFEQKLFSNLKARLSAYKVRVSGREGRYILSSPDAPAEVLRKVLSTTFGIVYFSPVLTPPKDAEAILDTAAAVAADMMRQSGSGEFKIEARRSDKSFPLHSYDLACLAGDYIRQNCPGTKVNLHTPAWTVYIEIRDQVLVYGTGVKGSGGLPVGSAGKGLLLLSGGIDSPVAGYLMAGRGLRLEAVYYHAYPFTSREAREKVETLTRSLAPFLQGTVLHVVSFTDIHLRIKEKSLNEELTLLLRACMMLCAEKLAVRRNAGCLVTGESLSQVASQTVESIHFTGSLSSLPVLRPLIGMDKQTIITMARDLGTYETSILPYEDCCTLFAPLHPLIRPGYSRMRRAFENLDIEELIEKSLEGTEKVYFTSAG
ncbi:MAG: tRNA 4-thiouridine(8) synthase ThiI [Spirochaetales bacterium]|nr:MAG: tRNA 4-thiouridine(8) synthase ThiI [Spirochaetales bacterium]